MHTSTATQAPAWVSAVQNGALLIDVRSQGEWDQGHIETARLVPVEAFSSRIADVEAWLGGDKSKPVVLYCRSGGRAGRAREMLLERGFTNVENAGGYDAVRSALARPASP